MNELYQGEGAVQAHEGTERMKVLMGKLGSLAASFRIVYGVVQQASK